MISTQEKMIRKPRKATTTQKRTPVVLQSMRQMFLSAQLTRVALSLSEEREADSNDFLSLLTKQADQNQKEKKRRVQNLIRCNNNHAASGG